jgi:HSP20 family protein
MEDIPMYLRRIPDLANWPTAFGDLEEARRGIERLFSSLNEFSGLQTAGVFPAINVSEDAEALFVRAELPGVEIEDLEISVENDTLTLAGERRMPEDADQVSYHRREREWGKFRRSFTLPMPVDSGRVQARYVDGILTVTLPKAPEARPRRIAVQASA